VGFAQRGNVQVAGLRENFVTKLSQFRHTVATQSRKPCGEVTQLNQQTMKQIKLTVAGLGVAAAIVAPAPQANAQATDSLIDKLVQKGVLSEKEARELRDESDKDFTRAFQAKTGMPDWVTSVRLGGDLRLRYDGIFIDHPNYPDRNRLRYRLRFGPSFTLFDDIEVGVRLGSGENKPVGSNAWGDPISGNDTFTANGAKKPLWIDLAFVKWNAINSGNWGLTLTGGKMENPFQVSDIVFDPDYTPEGFAANLSCRVNDAHSLKWNNGFFALREVAGSSKDSYLMGTQLRWDAAWNSKLSTTLGASLLAIRNAGQLQSTNAPDVNVGNFRKADGALASNFNPVVLDGYLGYTLDSFPLYAGKFPIRIGGEYVKNPGANSIRDNAYMAGITLGKSGKRGTWDLSYRWKRLEGDYWYEELVDSDHGAYYVSNSLPGRSTIKSYGPGVNIQGHYIRGAYSPTDYLTLSVTYYLFKLIDTTPGAANPDTGRIQVDAAFKF
jgi:polyhydroxyalkanoate synthesis regulator phasin